MTREEFEVIMWVSFLVLVVACTIIMALRKP